MPPGVEKFGFVENLATFLKGESAMTISWPPYGRFAAGYLGSEKALEWVPKSDVAEKWVMRCAGWSSAIGCGIRAVGRLQQQEQGGRVSLHPVAEQRGDQHQARSTAVHAARSVPRLALHRPVYFKLWPDAKDYLAATEGGFADGLLDLSLIQTDKYEEALRQASAPVAGEDPRRSWTTSPSSGRRHRQDRAPRSRRRLQRVGRKIRRVSEVSPDRLKSIFCR